MFAFPKDERFASFQIYEMCFICSEELLASQYWNTHTDLPIASVSYDDNGLPISGSFDASGVEDEDTDPNTPRAPRLIMRQENTHRVILNTVISKVMKFTDKPAASTAQILFTAFEAVEGEEKPKPHNLLLKVFTYAAVNI